MKAAKHFGDPVGAVTNLARPGGPAARTSKWGLSKKGDRYLRSLLVNGAMAVVRQAKIRPHKQPWAPAKLGAGDARARTPGRTGARLREGESAPTLPGVAFLTRSTR